MQKHDFSVLDQKYPFWQNLVQKVKINSLSWNLLDYCNLSMQNLMIMFTFPVFNQKYSICQIFRIHWCCSLFFVLTGNTFFGQIWSKKSKFKFRLKFGIKTNLNIKNSIVMSPFFSS